VNPGAKARQKKVTELEVIEDIHEEKPKDKKKLRRVHEGAGFRLIRSGVLAHRRKLYNGSGANSNGGRERMRFDVPGAHGAAMDSIHWLFCRVVQRGERCANLNIELPVHGNRRISG
jgi:hypothetical protein